MLALTRRINEEVIITLPDGTEFSIVVALVHGDKVRLKFNAPKNVIINRKELHELKKKELLNQ